MSEIPADLIRRGFIVETKYKGRWGIDWDGEYYPTVEAAVPALRAGELQDLECRLVESFARVIPADDLPEEVDE